MTAPYTHEAWEGDTAYMALRAWMGAWRDDNPVGCPNWPFTAHLSREAVALAKELGRVEVIRLFSASGYDGKCACGRTPAGVLADSKTDGGKP